jgi:hypothetical protein
MGIVLLGKGKKEFFYCKGRKGKPERKVKVNVALRLVGY